MAYMNSMLCRRLVLAVSVCLALPIACSKDQTEPLDRRDAKSDQDATARDAMLDSALNGDAHADAHAPAQDAMPDVDADMTLHTVPGGKHNFSVVYGNLDSAGTTWARHATLSFDDDGSVGSTYWHWESSLDKGKTALTSHRCTFEGVTKECSVYVPTGWIEPAKSYTNRSGTFALSADGGEVHLSWEDGQEETWNVGTTSTPTLASLSFQSSNFGITHGVGYGSDASWATFRTLPEIVSAGGLKRWPGKIAGAFSADRETITTSDWRDVSLGLTDFTSASASSEGYTLHAMLPHSARACNGPCTGERTGFIMYHLASTNKGRQMAYNNWCTCLSLGDEWPCYNRNMHPWAFMSIIDDEGVHRGWLFIEQQNQSGYIGYQYQLGYFTDL